jgi:hypothetical protein
VVGVNRKRAVFISGGLIQDCSDAGFNVFGDFRQGGTSVGRRKFEAVVRGGIMAGGEVDGAIEFAALNFVSDGGSGSKSFAEQGADVVLLENVDGERGKFFRVEAGVVGDEDGGIFGFGIDVPGDSGDGEADGVDGEIVGDDAAPAGSSKLDRRRVHGRVF